VVRDPRIGRLRVAATYADWAAVHEGQPSPSAPGGDWRSQVTERVRAAGTVSPPFAVP
jgi:hypothetical protein